MNHNLETLYVAFKSELACTDKEAAELADMFNSKDAAKQAEVVRRVNAKFAVMDDFFADRMVPESYRKSVSLPSRGEKSSGGLESNSATFNVIENYFNAMQIDTKWMEMFRTYSATGKDQIELLDWFSKVVHKEYQDGELIQAEPIGQGAFERMGYRRFGGAAFVLRRLSLNQARYNLTNILISHQRKEMATKADFAYTAIAAATPAGTTAFATNIINSINKGAVDLLTSLAGTNGYNVNDDTPLKFLAHGSHKSAVLSAFDTLRGDNGNNIRLRYNVEPVFTFNSNYPAQIGGVDYGKLILPGEKNAYGNFENARVEEVRNPHADASEIVYQYYFNLKVKGVQVQRVNLA
jgi:hypothetical protein